MKAWMIVLVLVAIGVVGAWVGYWAGHVLGWSTNAEFPLKVGGGSFAIGLSILASFGSVMLGTWWFVGRPLRRVRRLLATGVPGHATVRRVWRTGITARRRGDVGRHQLAFDLEVHPEGGGDYPAKAIGMLSDAEEAPLKPGVEVSIRYDGSHPASVVVVGPLPAAAG